MIFNNAPQPSPAFIIETGTEPSWYGRDPRYMITNVAQMTKRQEQLLSGAPIGSRLRNSRFVRWLRGEI